MSRVSLHIGHVLQTCLILAALITTASAKETCKVRFSQFPSANFSTCATLPVNGAQLSWSWNNVTRIMSAVFVHKPEASGGWVAWGINHNGTNAMAIASALACYPDSSTGAPIVKQYLLRSTSEAGVKLGGELNVVTNSCVIDSTTSPQTIYLQFDINLGSKPKINQIYGGGPGVISSTFTLQRHSPSSNLGAFVDIRNTTGITEFTDVTNSHKDFKNTHGALNVVGWGILLPIGAIFSRYLKPFADPLWFYLHGSVQVSGYVIGTVGFGYGIKLWDWSSTDRITHRALGIAIFALATLQILVLIVKPKKESSVRIYWNLYHWMGGYSVIVLAIVNNLIGFHILEEYGDWRTIYIIVIAALGGVAVILECVTWVAWFKRKPVDKEEEEELKKDVKLTENGN